jgi:outer membrane receptor protein involved in Fe transport
MCSYLRLLSFCFFALIISNIGFAQEALKMNMENLKLEQVHVDDVSIATKNIQSITEAPSIVSLINESSIDKFDWISINEAVSNLPGFSLNRDFERTVISSRGVFENWYNNHTLLLIDGIPFNDNIFGSAFTSEVTPLCFTRSIEIIRGTGSALYGSNAMNGVIGLSTLRPQDMEKNIGVKYRGDGKTNILDIITAGRTTLADFVVGFNYFETDGMHYKSYDGTYRTNENGDTLKFPYNDERQSNYLFLKIEGKEQFKGFSFQFHNQFWRYQMGLGINNFAPDQPENMLEALNTAILKYNTPSMTEKFQQEYVVSYRRRYVDWNIRFMPYLDSTNRLTSDMLYGYHPNGINEIVNSFADSYFTRAQIKYQFDNKASVLIGAENSVFIYSGDKNHLSNINLVTAENNDHNEFIEQGPWMPFIKDHPVFNTSLFGQYISPKLFSNKVQITLGLRYDREFFNFTPVDKPDSMRSTETRIFKHVSPRVAVVIKPNSRLVIKALIGNAFRMPAPNELFTYMNTWTTTTYDTTYVNARNLQPEYITTYEGQFIYQLSRNYNFQINFFRTDFHNQIIFNYYLNNTLNFTNIGFETELNVNFNNLNLFVNYMFVKRTKEKLLNDPVDSAVNKITWTPSQLANLGIVYQWNKLMISLNSQYRGEILRRPEDFVNDNGDDISTYRHITIPQSFRHNMQISYAWSKNITSSIFINNILNTTSYYAKSWSYPFDYRMNDRSIRFEMSFKF